MDTTNRPRGGTAKRRILIGTMACAAAGAATVVLAPTAANADTTGCTFGSSGGNTQTCLDIGNGVVSVGSSVVASGQGRELSSCLRLANGTSLGCTGYEYVGPGQGIGLTYTENTNGPTYCAVTWRQNPDGSTTQIGSYCAGQGTTTIG